TAAGPLRVNVLRLNPDRHTVTLHLEMAHGEIAGGTQRISQIAAGDPLSVAAVNGDYFAISGDGAPVGGIISNAQIIRSPMKRAMFFQTDDGSAGIGELSLEMKLAVGGVRIPLTAVDRRPYEGAAIFLPVYGAMPQLPEATVLALSPIPNLDGAPPFGTYRVLRVVNNLRPHAPGYYLAYGQDAQESIGLPSPNAILHVDGTLLPFTQGAILTAFGGGPYFLRDGAYQHDPAGPNGASFAARIPTTAIALTATGQILLVEVDGKNPYSSIGLRRRELAALMLALGARDAMALDGGGSSTMLARTLGSRELRLLNQPSDGRARRLAEAIVLRNIAPIGAPVALVARPNEIHALVGARVRVRALRVDRALHPLSAVESLRGYVEPSSVGVFSHGYFFARAPGRATIDLRSGALAGRIAVEVVEAPQRLRILPRLATVAASGVLRLRARARDADGFRLDLPTDLPWSASTGSIDAHGVLSAATTNTSVGLRLGGIGAIRTVRVGEHDEPLALGVSAHFLSAPAGEPGALRFESERKRLALRYDFRGDERAAFAILEEPLPAHAIALRFTVRNQGNAGILRVAMRDARNDDVLVTAGSLSAAGTYHLRVDIPQSAQPPLRLTGIYVVRALGAMSAVRTSGRIELSNLRAVIAGARPEKIEKHRSYGEEQREPERG
ncbi:MAG TPA: phosphodiester glycosidase family protein, partial [Candidatus Dormibacteraeota bacterium]|nr:phosphodiester glycosidase family protein [Candidatus Dormibacteraeota bacterium]